ncbi:DmpA family aminopeptidase [Geminicoccus roseus]|uniref:DmpA family aminopeptidase n=1 Tax=Geminicoccus roseus TaxID=404900 RepID=UPI000415D202|nr:P1 family peptidase [Geminicoccus roseus]
MTKPRARDLGLDLAGTPGPLNAITDVPGVAVGLATIREETPRPGRRLPVRTGVTAILPRGHEAAPEPVYAGIHRFNGNGEMTGSHWIEDGGYFLGPVLITNTHSVGIAHHAAVRWMLDRHASTYGGDDLLWVMPVVAETYDGMLNDINGQHVTVEHVHAALDGATGGPVAEGSTGGGTGMIAYEFKGGTGTASRRVTVDGRDYMLGALVQANHGRRDWLTVTGVPVGRHLRQGLNEGQVQERGSIIVVIATDIPMAPHQLQRVARRCSIGIGRNGTPGGNNSGDIFLAFSTANRGPMPHQAPGHRRIEMVNDELFDPIYLAVVESVEEAVLNAMLAGEATGGTVHDRFRIEALPVDELQDVLRRHRRPLAA